MTADRDTSRPSEVEQRYRRLLEAVTDYVYHVRVENGQAVATVHGAACEAVTGYAPQEFAANPMLWIEIVPPEDRDVVKQQANRILHGQHAPSIEHRIRRKDAQVRWVLNTVSAQQDAHGNLVAYDGLLRDITKRKQAEEAVERLNTELEQRVADRTKETRLLAEAVSHLGEGVLITDDDLDWPGPRIVFVNDAMCRITGYAAHELVGKSPRILQGDGSDRETLDRIKKELSAGSSCRAELVNYRKDGSPYNGELFITPLVDAGGRRTNFVSIHRDVTERKRADAARRASEERLRAILNTAADAIITIDRRGNINDVNPASERMFGYARDELVGQNVKILMPPPYCDEHDGYIARYLETGEARIIGVGRELVGRHKDGSTLPVGLTVSEVDHLGLFTGIIRDISAVRSLEKQVLEIAAEEDRRIGQELHDTVQQELTGLGLLAQTVLDRVQAGLLPDQHQVERVAKGLADAGRKVRLLSRGLIPVEVDAHGLSSALAELANWTSHLGALNCKFSCDEPVELADSLTATQLYRIALEAVNNAVKHSQASRLHIQLTSDGDRLVLRVADNGIGIDPTKTDSQGAGLNIMAYRAGLIGGAIKVAENTPSGTAVTCTLPLGDTAGPSRGRPGAIVPPLRRDVSRGGRGSV